MAALPRAALVSIDEVLVGLRIDEGMLKFSVTVYDRDDQLLVKIEDNEWVSGDPLPFQHSKPGGEVHTFDFSLKPMRDQAGKIVRLLAEGRDVTDRHRAEAAIRESAMVCPS